MDTITLLALFMGLVAGVIVGWTAHNTDRMLHTTQESTAEATDAPTLPPVAAGPSQSSYGGADTPPVASKMEAFTPPDRIKGTIIILRCSDPMMWYNDHINEAFPCLGSYYDPMRDRYYYWSREPSGMRNIVLKSDAKLIGEC